MPALEDSDGARLLPVGDPWQDTAAGAFEALAHAHGTPYFLYDADVVNARVRAVREAFAPNVEVYYAVKCNPNLGLLRAVSTAADGVDISSRGELEQALLAGFPAESMSFAGPAKTADELTAAIRHSVGVISIESMRELLACVRASQTLGIAANVALRVNPILLNRAFSMKMGGKAVQFGIDEENVGDIIAAMERHSGEIAFQGIHVYAGSQCFDPAGIVEGVANTFRIARAIEGSSSLTCRVINLGGGFGVSHVEGHRELDLATLAASLRPVIAAFIASSPVQRTIVFELGRYLTATAGLYVTRVISSKISRGKTFFMVDGGLHHHLAAAGTFGAALRTNFMLRNLSRPGAPVVRCHVAGPSCNPTDLLGIDVDLPRPETGDLVGVLKSGSYGLTASPVLFLGRQTPAELVRHNGAIILGRKPHVMTEFN
jgi:diaminopimelate decarboxylase